MTQILLNPSNLEESKNSMNNTLEDSTASSFSIPTDEKHFEINDEFNTDPNDTLFEESEVDNSTSSDDSEICLTEEFRKWALHHQIKHSALYDLLKILKNFDEFRYLPKCSKIWLNTCRSVHITHIGRGELWYNPLQTSLREIFQDLTSSITISLTFNIDCLPISRSLKSQFWPILAVLNNFPDIQPIVIAVFYGETKPPVNEFLEQFVDELLTLTNSGIKINDHDIKTEIKCFICDTPARSFIKGTVSHNAYHICMKCTEAGEYDHHGHHISFAMISAPLRTDTQFRNREDLDHNKTSIPIERLQ